MDNEALSTLKAWFTRYTAPFRKTEDANHPLEIKWRHTFEVCKLCVLIGRGIGLPQEKLNLLEAAGLCHDVGRFEQYTRYGTFVDRKSEDHALLAVRILRENDALSHIEQQEAETVFAAVENHNKASLPRMQTDALHAVRILRDADKLDILRILDAHYSDRERGIENSSIELELPDVPGLSAEVCGALLEKRCADYRHLRSSNDFKLAQMGWAYDLNYQPSLRLFREKDYLGSLRSRLPASPLVERIHRDASEFLEQRLAAS